MIGVLFSKGSVISKKPLAYVLTNVAKEATRCNEDSSSTLFSCNVLVSEASRSAQNLFHD